MHNHFAEYSADQARDALLYLDAGCPRDQWIRIGMAAQAIGLTEEDFIEWSRSGSNFDSDRDVRSQWKSFKPGGGIGAGTLFKLARDVGWKPTTLTPTYRAPIEAPQALAESNIDASALKPNLGLEATFNQFEPATADHPYIAAKCGIPDGLRVVPAGYPLIIGSHDMAGWLAVPVRSINGMLCTVQFVPPPGAGRKLNAPGAEFQDGIFVVGDLSKDSTVYLTEGIGQAWACAKADNHAAAVVTFGCGRTRTVARMLRKRFPEAHLIIVPDRGKEPDAERIAQETKSTWVSLPAEKPVNYDANDFESEHGIEALAKLLRASKVPPTHYRLLSIDELIDAPPMRWMIQGVLPASGLAALYGPSGAGKSFLVLDACAAIASGTDWFDHRVVATDVTYVCLEGEGGIGKRVKAWRIHNSGAKPQRLHFVVQPFDLRNPEDVVDLYEAVLAQGGRNGLVVLDTLNRATPGADENSSTDMGQIINAAKDLQQRLDGLVLLVHHTGKDTSKGLRGHSSLYAALDAAIEVSRNGQKRQWSQAKSKDDADGGSYAFDLPVIDLGVDEFGAPITSCAVAADDSLLEIQDTKLPRGENQRIAIDTLDEALAESDTFGRGAASEDTHCLSLETAIRLVAGRLTCEDRKRNERAKLALDGLVKNGLLVLRDGWVWRA